PSARSASRTSAASEPRLARRAPTPGPRHHSSYTHRRLPEQMPTIERVAVLGAGTMGHGIAQVSAAAGYSVALHDSNAAQLEHALGRVRENLDKGVQRGKVRAEDRDLALERLRTEDDLAAAVAD